MAHQNQGGKKMPRNIEIYSVIKGVRIHTIMDEMIILEKL